MNKETLDATSRLIGVVLDELAMPAEITDTVRRIADRVLGELARIDSAAVKPPDPTIFEELAEGGQRATINIGNTALMVTRLGAPVNQVRDLIRGHLLAQSASEQLLIHSLLSLTCQAQTRRGDLH